MGNPMLTLLVAVLTLSSGLLGALITAWFQRRWHNRIVKVDTLRRLVAYRYHIADQTVSASGEPFVALNEVFVVYSDDPKVLEELEKFHDRIYSNPETLADDLLRLIRVMAKSTKTKLGVADNLVKVPFVPKSATR